jgi:glycerate 2-kinase
MFRSNQQLHDDALAIWRAGLAAVDSERLVGEHIVVEGKLILVEDQPFSIDDYDRIIIVGAGKAGAGMAAGLEQVLNDWFLAAGTSREVVGLVNVPADCVRALRWTTLHAARPAGVNEPTEAGVRGTSQILDFVRSLTDRDLCFCLLSGGGSALMPAPLPGITLADKQAVTRHLSASGANITELNTVRKQLSRIKGGGLAQASSAGRIMTLIISDVLGDPLDVIASGPTVADSATAQDALRVLQKFDARSAGISPQVFNVLERARGPSSRAEFESSRVMNIVIGNNATAVDAAGMEAERRGYSHSMIAARKLEGPAEEIGRHHAQMARSMTSTSGPDCLITGGEPTVQLAPANIRGKGGRNQQLVLAALDELQKLQRLQRSDVGAATANPLDGMAILSGGTDGEDGPTDAAGAILDANIAAAARQRQLDASDYLRRNDAYHFFEPFGGLIKTGPTHTNVCDVRVVVVNPSGIKA